MHISSASYAYPDLGSEDRAAIARRLTVAAVPDDTVVLSTCLRVEVVCGTDRAGLEASARELLGDLFDGIEGRTRTGADSVTHLARVAAGLESPIVGEIEILSQFRHAVRGAVEERRVGGIFARLLESTVSIGRRARDLMPGSGHASMGSIAAQVVADAPDVAVLGSGTMAQAVVDGLRSLPAPPSITVLARRPDAVRIQGVTVWPFERALEAIGTFPAVVSATSAKQRPVDDRDLGDALAERAGTLLLVDMAMPPDFVPPAGASVRYVNIDDLAKIAERRPRAEHADAFVAEAAAEAHRRYAEHHEVGPVISGMVAVADETVEQAIQRFSGRLTDPDDLDVLRQAVHTVSRSLIAGPIDYVKRSERADALGTIAEAFGVSDE